MPRAIALAAALFVSSPLAAQAQIERLPAEIGARIAAMGPRFDADVLRETGALFAALPAPSTDGLRVSENQSYGPDPRHRLSVYSPAQEGSSRPILVFVHGGGFVRGDIAPNVAAYAARNGLVGIAMTYRLAPQNPWPAGAQDVGRAIAWIRENAARLGGDPARIILFGHSAGATHAAGYALDPALHPAGGPGIAGLILGSGFLKMTEADKAPNNLAYFGTDPATYATRSPMTHLAQSRLPVLLFNAQYDPAFLGAPTLEMATGICWRDGHCPRVVTLRGHNHVSELYAVGTADDELGQEILRFVRETR
ncbi:alpha/beta hydrolase [Roseomonas populi]|uniref:Alpha/beta hydrolase n=1 Tax=Roseomonas populi TaxID=3121582 RepID=A0ABT1WYL6_9PROT|nr:alpha/beta hydrolase [Roseomonas pecuniae]MCR0980938.1 alpha/beta hydrolase [Roseomonas pecuniae]